MAKKKELVNPYVLTVNYSLARGLHHGEIIDRKQYIKALEMQIECGHRDIMVETIGHIQRAVNAAKVLAMLQDWDRHEAVDKLVVIANHNGMKFDRTRESKKIEGV